MWRNFLRMLVQGMLPVVPCLWVAGRLPARTIVPPWPEIMLTVLAFNLLLALFGRRYLGDTRSERQGERLLMLAAVFEPLVTYRLFLAGSVGVSVAAQVFAYSIGQSVLWGAIELAPGICGRRAERRYADRVLSGKETFASRKEVLEERERRAAKKSKRASGF